MFTFNNIDTRTTLPLASFQCLHSSQNLQIHKLERYRYSHLFSMNCEKIYPYIRKSMGISFHIWELCGLPNSINFQLRPILWEQGIFSFGIFPQYDILLDQCSGDCLAFPINSYFLKTHTLGMILLSTEYFHGIGIHTFPDIGDCMGSH